MTALQRLKDLLESFGVKYLEECADAGNTTLTLTAGSCPACAGYTGFMVDWTFSPSGDFIHMGIWE